MPEVVAVSLNGTCGLSLGWTLAEVGEQLGAICWQLDACGRVLILLPA